MSQHPENPSGPTDALAALVREKRRVLTQLHQVGERQGELVALGDVPTLLRLLAAKQKLLAGLQAVEARLHPYRDQDPDGRAWPSPQHRAACAADADECRRLLAAVMDMERRHEQQMATRRDKLAEQLQRTHTAHGASDAYRTHRLPSAPTATPTTTTPPTGTPAPRVAPLSDLPTSTGIDLTSEA
ncbi:MAG: hypothetical protein AAF790_11485 [Planctomycetota bacterium]